MKAPGMALFRLRQGFEAVGDFVHVLFPGGFRHARIHVGIFVGLTGDRRFQIVAGRADRLPGRRITGFLEELQMAMGMTGLAFRGRPENGGDIVVTLDVGLLGKLQIAAICLALAGECGLQILFRLASLQRHSALLRSQYSGQNSSALELA